MDTARAINSHSCLLPCSLHYRCAGVSVLLLLHRNTNLKTHLKELCFKIRTDSLVMGTKRKKCHITTVKTEPKELWQESEPQSKHAFSSIHYRIVIFLYFITITYNVVCFFSAFTKCTQTTSIT